MSKSNDILIGMSAICRYYGNVSPPTILSLIHKRGFPATKQDSNTWKSSKELIDRWNQEKIKADLGLKNNMFGIETRPEISEIEQRKNTVKQKNKHMKRKIKHMTEK